MRRAIRERSIADRSIRFKVAARRTPVNLVEDVEEICTELDGRLFTDRKALLDCQIRIEKVRTINAVPPNGSNLIQTRLCEECTWAGKWKVRLAEEVQVVARRAGDV